MARQIHISKRPGVKFTLYVITCSVNGMQYVGCTSLSMQARFERHLYEGRSWRSAWRNPKDLYGSIKEFGPECFSIEHVGCAEGWRNGRAVEQILMRQYGTKWPRGYNLDGYGSMPHESHLDIKARLEKVGRGHQLTTSPESEARFLKRRAGVMALNFQTDRKNR